jgi:hypothetical protein
MPKEYQVKKKISNKEYNKSKENRKILYNPRVDELKTRIRDNLISEKGFKLKSI